MEEVLHKKELDHAIEFMLAVVANRTKEDGFAWWTQEESGQIMKRFSLNTTDLKTVYNKVEDVAGQSIEVFKEGFMAARIVWIMKKIKANGNGTFSDEQRAECEKAFPNSERTGLAVRSAMVRLGFLKPSVRGASEEEVPPPQPGYLGDVGVMLKRYQELLQKKYVKEQEIVAIDRELELYKPLAQVMEAAKKTVQNIKENAS